MAKERDPWKGFGSFLDGMPKRKQPKIKEINCPWKADECPHYKNGYCHTKKQNTCPIIVEDFA